MFEVRGEGLGAEIYGIDVARPQDVDVQALREVVYRHKLVVLKDIDPTPKQFLDWGKTLGEVRPYYEPIYHHSEYPEIFVSSTDQQVGGVPKTGAFWHIDYQFMPEPFAFTMTLPRAVPSNDRGTYFIDLAEAWKRIPEELQNRVRGTRTINSPRRYVKIRPSDVYRPIGEVIQEIETVTPPQTWPTVITHPGTGEEILYICEAFTERIVWDEDGEATGASREGHDLVKQLLELSGQAPESDPDQHPLVHTQLFDVGDALLWDNRALVHRAKHCSVQGTVTTHRVTMMDGLVTPGVPA